MDTMAQKICLVTGANAGIGKETAQGLANRGATVIMVCRSAERGQAAQDEIKRTSGNEDVHLFLADLASQAAIHRLADDISAAYGRIDVLVNNAGAFFTERNLTVDGIELTLALNHLGYFLLTMRLLPLLEASPQGRIINVSSDAHRGARLSFDNLQFANGYSGFRAYAQSKLANILFTRELARRMADTSLTVNALHPGFVASNFGKNNGAITKLMMTLLRPFARSSERGAETSLYLATADNVSHISGAYFADKKMVTPSVAARDAESAARLWAISEELTGMHVAA